jgi:Zn-dependent peptidase ImmA (M78 family)
MDWSDVIGRAEQDAVALLEAVGVDPQTVPIDPVRIARELDLQVFISPMDSELSGALVKERGEDPVIYLSAADAVNRRRFTCAHELGHYQQHVGAAEIEFIEKREVFYNPGTKEEEVYANAFAAALLMPAASVRIKVDETPGMPNPAVLARFFGVSAESMAYRLKNLKIVR